MIPVQVVPQAGFAATFDNATPALGDTITLTAAPGIAFADTAELRLPGVPDTIPLHPIIVARGEGGTSLSFIAPPNVNGPLIITAVTSVSAPGLVFSPATDRSLQTPLIDTVDVTYSTRRAAGYDCDGHRPGAADQGSPDHQHRPGRCRRTMRRRSDPVPW